MSDCGKDGYLDMDWRRLLLSTRAGMECIPKDANLGTAFAISSSDLYILDVLISGAKLTYIFACSLANLIPFSHSPWYRTEANAHTTRASWGLFTNARWNASSPVTYTNIQWYHKHLSLRYYKFTNNIHPSQVKSSYKKISFNKPLILPHHLHPQKSDLKKSVIMLTPFLAYLVGCFYLPELMAQLKSTSWNGCGQVPSKLTGN